MKLFAFWPILLLLGVDGGFVMYWENGMSRYETLAECEARLPALEQEAMKNQGFRETIRGINGGVLPEMSFQRECIDKRPIEYHRELWERGSGERT
jgi:hypothetical protein